MKKKNILRYIVLPLLLVIGLAAVYIYREYNRTHKDTSRLKPDFEITATGLLNEFVSNETASNKKYWDKVVLVNGVVKELNRDERGLYTAALGDTSSLSAVRCVFDSTHGREAAVLQVGQSVSIKGICSGFNADELLGSDVILVRCVAGTKK
jgi:tRNA_anti-like